MAEAHVSKSVLYPGQQLHLHASCGMTVVALQGDVLLYTSPVYIGEQMVRSTIKLHEGQSHLLADDGWITVHARTRAELACVAGQSKARLWPGRLLQALLTAWRQGRLASGLRRDG
jgi:hypothetical protein